MTFRNVLVSCCLTVGILFGAGQTTAGQSASTSDLSATHRAALDTWLKSKPGLRLATEKDCRNLEGLAASRAEYGREYQPYYAVGDFNRDGRQDFAVTLINDQKRSRKFAIAIFNGPHNQRLPWLPAFFVEGMDLSEGGLVVLSGTRLIAGVFQSDNCVVLQPRGRTYVMKSCM